MDKGTELLNPNSCLNKACDDEPLFVLRANDPIAPQTIRHWVTMSWNHKIKGGPSISNDKRAEALDIAIAMEKWRAKNAPSIEPPAVGNQTGSA